MTDVNIGRLRWDLRQNHDPRYEDYWRDRNTDFIPREVFDGEAPVCVEIGAGTGWFVVELAKMRPQTRYVAIERCRFRGNRLVHRAGKSKLPNLHAFRGNAIPAFIHGVPTESVDRIYILYPCPFPKASQRKNRWYQHPIMPHIVRILKRGGLLIWASDQKFYIDEAHFVCTQRYNLEPLAFGSLTPNPFNDLQLFSGGRTKFEATFQAQALPCYELIVQKA